MTDMREPLIPEVGIIGLVYHRWSLHWMTPHHVLTRLANYFHVLWLEPPPHTFELNLCSRPFRPEVEGADLPKGFEVLVHPWWLPVIDRFQWLRQRSYVARIKSALKALQHRGCKKVILYMWHHQFEVALDCHDYDFSLYHIDDEYSFSPTRQPPNERELRVMRQVNQVIVVSPELMERKQGANPHMAFIPEGVDFELYAAAKTEPMDIAQTPHPRIGYTGWLKRQLDWPLLKKLAERHPQWSFVFVGPTSVAPEQEGLLQDLSTLKNVYMLGPKSVLDLASYPQHFDVCIMPYLVNDYTNCITL